MSGRTLTRKQLQFCLLIVEGLTNSKAYAKAGYKVPATRKALEANASKLLATPSIQTQVAQLRAPAIRKTQISLEKLTDELMAITAQARQLEQPAAATGALALVARLHGFLVDHKQVDITHHKPAREPIMKDLELSEDEWLRLYKPQE
jgi:phage terminase small subunit